ncbi:MAG: sterol desaturase family protein [Novosphingobium sp.]|nr:sterol desaturase family protein [Novosphingobium sp.]
MPTLPYLALSLIVIAAIVIAERRWNPQPTDWRRNLEAWLVQLTIAETLLPLIHGWGAPAWLDGARMPFLLGFAVFLVARDFAEFAFHVAQHRVPLLWAMHSLHHSDPEMSTTTAARHFWGDQLLKAVTVWPAAALVVAPTPAMVLGYSLVAFYHYFIHADLRVDFGRWSWLLNSPAYHRRHHSQLPEHYGSNFAGLLPVFDVLAGSYRRPDGWPPTGLEQAPQTFGETIAWPLVLRRREAAGRSGVSPA